ncbi:MAG: hypothetical protein ABSH49_14725, partial [Bryobacteraceae bacterium]
QNRMPTIMKSPVRSGESRESGWVNRLFSKEGYTPEYQELKFTLHRKLPVGIVALIYNWWSLFTRLAIPNRHTEATTSRPLLLHGIGRQTTHGNQTTLTITSNHAQAEPIRRALEGVSRLLQRLVETAEQFTVNQRWRWLLRFIFRDWLKTRPPDPRFLPLTALANCRI